ncbi:MAG: RNA methyltransferase [Bdellovibrionales bacterium]|nr:RNA methyltransferase [Bdellovibrionales bacterium]
MTTESSGWEAVEDPHDSRIAPFRGLRGRDTLTIADGIPSVREVLASGLPLRVLLAESGREAELDTEIARLRPEGAGMPALKLRAPRELLSELVGYRFHQGALAAFDPPPDSVLEELGDRIVAFDRLEKGENVGAILRSSVAFGVQSFLMGTATVSPWDRRVLRASRGLALRGRVHRTDHLPRTLRELKARGYALAVAMPESAGARGLWDADWPERLVLCLGNEAQGVSEEIQTAADFRLHIPMAPGVNSLNVAVAGSVLLSWLWARSPTPSSRR